VPATAQSRYQPYPRYYPHHGIRVDRPVDGPYFISRSTGKKVYLQSPYYNDNGNYPL
jgi:hypothetical protein